MAGSGPPTKDDSLVQAALKVLNTPSPWDKAKYTAEAVKLWKGRQLRCVYEAGVDDTVWRVPDRPARADDKARVRGLAVLTRRFLTA